MNFIFFEFLFFGVICLIGGQLAICRESWVVIYMQAGLCMQATYFVKSHVKKCEKPTGKKKDNRRPYWLGNEYLYMAKGGVALQK